MGLESNFDLIQIAAKIAPLRFSSEMTLDGERASSEVLRIK